MNSVELVKQICKERNIPISRLERQCRFSNGYIRRLTRGVFPSDKLQIIADYLDVSVEYLMNGGESQETEPETQKEEWYTDKETAKLAQEMFEDPDMRALYHMKRGMEPEKFAAHMKMMRELYRLEHPEEFQEDKE